MRINPVNLNQALSRTQSAGVGAVPRVIAKPASVQASEINTSELSPQNIKQKNTKNKTKRNKRKNNLDLLGCEVDVWV